MSSTNLSSITGVRCQEYKVSMKLRAYRFAAETYRLLSDLPLRRLRGRLGTRPRAPAHGEALAVDEGLEAHARARRGARPAGGRPRLPFILGRHVSGAGHLRLTWAGEWEVWRGHFDWGAVEGCLACPVPPG